jgi:DNA-binding CsgD family transcriptional regulator
MRSGREALTHGERRVGELAAAGHTNKEIAQQLFVSLRTVETHLTNAYRKLGITSRAELGAALGHPPEEGGRTPARPGYEWRAHWSW